MQGDGVYYSADNGESWTQITSGFKAATVSVIALDSSGSILVGTSQDLYRNTNAPILSVKKQLIDFGSVKNGQAKDTSIAVINVGGSTLDITDMKIAGLDAADFQIVNKESISLEPNATKMISIRCSSGKNGDKEARIEFTSNTSGLTTEIALMASVSGSNSVQDAPATFFTADIYPNPVSSTYPTVDITSAIESKGEIRLVSSLGIPVFTTECSVTPGMTTQFALPLPSTLANGRYQAIIRLGGQSMSIPVSIIR